MPHFFHFVSNKTHSNKMLIPEKFVRKYGETLSDFMHVELSCGHEWKMKLVYSEGDVWLKNWSKFFDFYSLDRGHMIIFRYKGDSRFDVSICDTTEIDYPSVKFSKLDNEKKEQGIKRKTANDDSESPRKKTRTICTDEPQSDESEKSTKVGSGRNRLNKNERTTALERAKAFTSNLPFFMKVMKPNYLGSTYMNIDLSLANENLRVRGKSGEAILKLPNEKKIWPVKFDWYHGLETTAVLFYRGWNEFTRSNNLKVGDVCVFVLLRAKKVTFEVVIFRDNERSEGSSRNESESHVSQRKINTNTPKSKVRDREKTLSNSEKDRILEGIHFESEKPFFKIVMQPPFVNTDEPRVSVPDGFARKYMTKRDIVLRVPKSETCWSVQFKSTRKSGTRPWLYKGWDLFAESNNLEVGDTCVFELVDRTKVLFDVHIFRFTDQDSDSYLSRSQSKSRLSDENSEDSNDSDSNSKNRPLKNGLLKRAHFESKRPFFKLVMHSSYCNGYWIQVPSEFFHDHLMKRDGDIVLWVPNGSTKTTWTARFATVHRISGEVYGKIHRGWKEFAKCNNLKVGDVGIFELINKYELSFQVTIVRAPSTL